MSKRTGFRSVCIRPREDFGSFSDAVQLAGADGSIDLSPRLFDVPALAVLVDKQGMPMWLPTLYLVDCALRGRSVTGDTVRSYAEALITWFTFLDELGFCQEEVTEDVFALFRTDVAHSPSSSTGRVRSSATANHRVAVVCGFHLWGEKRGLLHTPLGCFLLKREEEHRGQSRLNMPYPRRTRSSLAPAVVQRLPTLLSYEEVRLLFQVAPSPYRLIFKWALLTGLRRFEICGLTTDQLPSPQQLLLSRDGFARINVLRKGGRDVTVHVPIRLVEETSWYVLVDRPTPARADETRIFIGKRGTAVSRGSLSKAFRNCADRVGTRATFHHLRHTFAVNVLGILEQRVQDGDSLNSIKSLQVLLGHASLESTEIYLRAMEVSSEAVMQALDYLYGATLCG